MSAPTSDGPLRKHRHDLGHEDHGPKLAAGTTRAIQGLLGLWIAMTVALILYVMWDGSRSAPIRSITTPGTAPGIESR
jgi:hypothetical protein